MIEAVIFDVDGTLVDSVNLHAKAWQVAFEKFDKQLSFEAIRRQIGKGADQLLPVFFSDDELRHFGRELEEYRSELFRAEYLPQVKPLAKVRELFERIRRDGRKIALASSAKEDELNEYKKIAQIDDLIEADTSSADVGQSKPHPDIFEAALKKLGNIVLDKIVVVGDTPHDAEAAANANMRMIGLLSGGWTEERLRLAGCIEVYRHPADLLARYNQSALRPTRGSPSVRSDERSYLQGK
ncbi:MAG TPA: HAD family hydrolase [Candidatus Binatia bacterium]